MTTRIQTLIEAERYEEALQLRLETEPTPEEIEDAKFRILAGMDATSKASARPLLNQAVNEIRGEPASRRVMRLASIAACFFKDGSDDQAGVYLRAALRLDHENAHLHFALGAVHLRKNQFQEAFTQFRRADELGHPEVKEILALSLVGQAREHSPRTVFRNPRIVVPLPDARYSPEELLLPGEPARRTEDSTLPFSVASTLFILWVLSSLSSC